eukprot:1192828-Pleurochrysis_carterae.AAC.6
MMSAVVNPRANSQPAPLWAAISQSRDWQGKTRNPRRGLCRKDPPVYSQSTHDRRFAQSAPRTSIAVTRHILAMRRRVTTRRLRICNHEPEPDK